MTAVAAWGAERQLAPRASGQYRRTRVAIVERFALVAEAIGLTLSRTGTGLPVLVTLPAMCPTNDACQSVRRTRADIAVLSLTRGGVQDPLTLIEELAGGGISLIVTGPTVDEESARLYRAAGAVAARQHCTVVEVVELVNSELSRHTVDSRTPTRLLADPSAPQFRATEQTWRARRNLGRLAPAEARILGQLMRGHTADEIAGLHVVSVATVRTQISRVLAKLEVSSQLSAVALAWQTGWEPSPEPVVA